MSTNGCEHAQYLQRLHPPLDYSETCPSVEVTIHVLNFGGVQLVQSSFDLDFVVQLDWLDYHLQEGQHFGFQMNSGGFLLRESVLQDPDFFNPHVTVENGLSLQEVKNDTDRCPSIQRLVKLPGDSRACRSAAIMRGAGGGKAPVTNAKPYREVPWLTKKMRFQGTLGAASVGNAGEGGGGSAFDVRWFPFDVLTLRLQLVCEVLVKNEVRAVSLVDPLMRTVFASASASEEDEGSSLEDDAGILAALAAARGTTAHAQHKGSSLSSQATKYLSSGDKKVGLKRNGGRAASREDFSAGGEVCNLGHTFARSALQEGEMAVLAFGGSKISSAHSDGTDSAAPYRLDIVVGRNWTRYIFDFLILIILVMAAAFSLYVPLTYDGWSDTLTNRLSITLTVVLALVSFTSVRPSVIEDLPYATLHDQYERIMLFFVALITIENLFVFQLCIGAFPKFYEDPILISALPAPPDYCGVGFCGTSRLDCWCFVLIVAMLVFVSGRLLVTAQLYRIRHVLRVRSELMAHRAGKQNQQDEENTYDAALLLESQVERFAKHEDTLFAERIFRRLFDHKSYVVRARQAVADLLYFETESEASRKSESSTRALLATFSPVKRSLDLIPKVWREAEVRDAVGRWGAPRPLCKLRAGDQVRLRFCVDGQIATASARPHEAVDVPPLDGRFVQRVYEVRYMQRERLALVRENRKPASPDSATRRSSRRLQDDHYLETALDVVSLVSIFPFAAGFDFSARLWLRACATTDFVGVLCGRRFRNGGSQDESSIKSPQTGALLEKEDQASSTAASSTISSARSLSGGGPPAGSNKPKSEQIFFSGTDLQTHVVDIGTGEIGFYSYAVEVDGGGVSAEGDLSMDAKTKYKYPSKKGFVQQFVQREAGACEFVSLLVDKFQLDQWDHTAQGFAGGQNPMDRFNGHDPNQAFHVNMSHFPRKIQLFFGFTGQNRYWLAADDEHQRELEDWFSQIRMILKQQHKVNVANSELCLWDLSAQHESSYEFSASQWLLGKGDLEVEASNTSLSDHGTGFAELELKECVDRIFEDSIGGTTGASGFLNSASSDDAAGAGGGVVEQSAAASLSSWRRKFKYEFKSLTLPDRFLDQIWARSCDLTEHQPSLPPPTGSDAKEDHHGSVEQNAMSQHQLIQALGRDEVLERVREKLVTILLQTPTFMRELACERIFAGTLSCGGGVSQVSCKGISGSAVVVTAEIPCGNRTPYARRGPPPLWPDKVSRSEASRVAGRLNREQLLDVEKWRDDILEAIKGMNGGVPREVRGLLIGFSAVFYAAKACKCADRILPKRTFLEALEAKWTEELGKIKEAACEFFFADEVEEFGIGVGAGGGAPAEDLRPAELQLPSWTISEDSMKLVSNLVLVHTWVDWILHDGGFIACKRNWAVIPAAERYAQFDDADAERGVNGEEQVQSLRTSYVATWSFGFFLTAIKLHKKNELSGGGDRRPPSKVNWDPEHTGVVNTLRRRWMTEANSVERGIGKDKSAWSNSHGGAEKAIDAT